FHRRANPCLARRFTSSVAYSTLRSLTVAPPKAAVHGAATLSERRVEQLEYVTVFSKHGTKNSAERVRRWERRDPPAPDPRHGRGRGAEFFGARNVRQLDRCLSRALSGCW